MKFFFVHDGRVSSTAGEWRPWSVAKLERNEAIAVTALERTVMTVLSLPEFSDDELAAPRADVAA